MKKTVYLTMAAVVCAVALTGCRKAPDVTESNGILHAQSDMERQVQDIAASDDRGQTQTENRTQPQAAGGYQGTVGAGGNIININAEIPAIPDNLSVITLKPDDGLDMDALRVFLDSESGTVEDTSQELLRQTGENDKENATIQENGDRFLYSGSVITARCGLATEKRKRCLRSIQARIMLTMIYWISAMGFTTGITAKRISRRIRWAKAAFPQKGQRKFF